MIVGISTRIKAAFNPDGKRQDLTRMELAIVTADGTGVYSYREIAEHFQLHLAIVGRIIRIRMLQCEN